MPPDQTQQGHDDDTDPDALDKIVSDESQQRNEDRQRGNLDQQDDTGLPRPSEDGDPDADADEPVAGRHETS